MNSQGIDISSGLVPKAPPDITAGLIPRDMASQDPLAQKANASQILDRATSLNPAGLPGQDTNKAAFDLGTPPVAVPASQQFRAQAENQSGAPLARQTSVKIPTAGTVPIAPKFQPVPDQSTLAGPAKSDAIGNVNFDAAASGSEDNTGLSSYFYDPRTKIAQEQARASADKYVNEARAAQGGNDTVFESAAQHPEQVVGNAIFPGVGEIARSSEELATPGERAQGAVRAAGGVADVLMPSATAALFEAPVGLAAGLASGAVAQKVGPVRRLAAAAGADQDTQNAASEVDFWLPTVIGSMIGLRAGSKEKPVYDADGTFLGTVKVSAVAAADGKIGAAVESTPTEHKFGVKVGDQQFTVSVPRARNPQTPPSAGLIDGEAPPPNEGAAPRVNLGSTRTPEGAVRAWPSSEPVPEQSPAYPETFDATANESLQAQSQVKPEAPVPQSPIPSPLRALFGSRRQATVPPEVVASENAPESFLSGLIERTAQSNAETSNAPQRPQAQAIATPETSSSPSSSHNNPDEVPTGTPAAKAMQAMQNPTANDNEPLHAALAELGGGKTFPELTPGEQSRVLMRSAEIKHGTAKPQKNDQVVLPDGREGTLKFNHPILPVSRVALDSGGSVDTSPRFLKKLDTEAPEPGNVGMMATKAIQTDPHRFQYKLATDAEGISPLLKSQFRFNPDLAGVIGVWKDPSNGKTYVVNGHHRLELARRTDAKQIAVRHIEAKDAAGARSIGALTNIAEGRGSSIDAAKFMRDTGITADRLQEHGVSLGEATARNGVALASLEDSLFHRVAQGDLPEGRAVAIADATKDHAEQKALADLVDRQESKGKRVTNDTIRELADFVKGTGKQTETTASLFGDVQVEKSLALEKAEVSSYIKQQLAKDRKLFGFVANEGRAAELSRAGNTIKTEENKRISESAAHAEAVYETLKNRSGKISVVLESAAEKLAAGENPNGVKQEAYAAIRNEVSRTLGGSEEPSRQGSGEITARRAPLSEEQTSGNGTVSEAATNPEPSLPGFEDSLREQREAVAAHHGETLANQLTAPAESIDKASGEIERSSPLFRDSGASGQERLFASHDESPDEARKSARGLARAAGSESGSAPLAANPLIAASEGLYDVAKPVAELLSNKVEHVHRAKALDIALAELGPQYQADVLRGVQVMKETPGTPADQSAIAHWIENHQEPLTEAQREIYVQWVKPLIDQANEIYHRLTDEGLSPDGYLHRVVKGEGSMLDRVMSGSKGTGGGNLLGKSAPSLKGRTMMALEPTSGSGNRQVVSIKHDRVTQYRNGKTTDLGPLSSGLTTNYDLQDARLEPIANRIGELNKQIAELPQKDRDAQLARVEAKLAELKAEHDTLESVRGRVPGQKAVHGIEVSFGKRKAITQKIDALEKQRDAIRAATGEEMLTNAGQEKLRKLGESLTVAKNQRGRVIEQFPTAKLSRSVWVDQSGKKWTITQATMKEIEAHSGVRYYHNAIASAVTNFLSLRKAERALDFMDELKSSPEFATIAVKAGAGNPPQTWRMSKLPQMHGYFFEPHIADVLNRYADSLYKDPSVLDDINNFLRTAIFFNPLIHVPNILSHAIVEKGVTGWMPQNWPKVARSAVRAINAVTHQNADYLEALDSGGPMQYQKFEGKKLADLFFEKLAGEMEQDAGFAKKLADALGYANPAKLISAIYGVSNRVTWWTNDTAFLAATYEKMEGGMSLKDALHETAKHIPDYRLPTHILGSKTVGTIMRSPLATMFGGYHYGALKSYGEMTKDAIGSDRTIKDRGHAFDVMAMLGLLTLVIYPLADELLKKATGNKDAELNRAGAATFPYNIYLLAKGEKSPREVAESVVTPSVVAKAGAELATNHDIRTSKAIYDTHAKPSTLAWQLAHKGSEYVAPVGAAERAAQDTHQAKRTALGLLGIRFRKHGAEKIAADIAASKGSKEAPTPESYSRTTLKRSLRESATNGDLKPAQDALDNRNISPQEYREIVKSERDGLLETVRSFDYRELREVYDAATPEQKKMLEPLLAKKQMQQKPTGSGLPFYLRSLAGKTPPRK